MSLLTIVSDGIVYNEPHAQPKPVSITMRPDSFLIYFYAYCTANDPINRPLRLNKKLQDYAVNNGIVFG